jgi:phage repressor protein C with HTH and peptisase S24 domain
MDLFAKNIKFLREIRKISQTEMATSMGFKQSAWSGYENGSSKPNFSDLMKIIKFFDITAGDLLDRDLKNAHLIENKKAKENEAFAHLIAHPNAHLKGKDATLQYLNNAEDLLANKLQAGSNMAPIPVADIAVAAGGGIYNDGPIDITNAVQLPSMFVRPGYTYLCVKIKGESMAPTLQDGGYVIIRLLDRSEWATMPDERVFVVIDDENKAYLKRVKNRFKKGLIILRSDTPDKASYPSFNLATTDITAIWYVEWYLSAKMPNIHDQYYSRLQQLEDKVDLLSKVGFKVNP